MLGRWKVRACSRGAVELKWSAGPPTWGLVSVWAALVVANIAWFVFLLRGGPSWWLLAPVGVVVLVKIAALPAFISIVKNVWTIGTVELRDGTAEAVYLGPGKLADVRVKVTGPVKVETRSGSSKETLRRVVAQAAGGEAIPLGPWLPPREAFRMAECLNRAHTAKRALR